MATAIYGGSPRHHSRMLVTSSSSGNKSTSATHLSSALALQQSTPFISGTPHSIVPPSSYLPSHHQQQQQHLHHHQQQQQQQQIHHHHALMQAQRSHHSKRKSAVELLAETKPYYVKSENVRDRQQQLTFSRPAPPSYIVSPSRTLPHSRSGNRRSASSSSDLLQTKLRKLLNAGDSKETITPESIKYQQQQQSESSPTLKYEQFQYNSPKLLNQELTVHPEQNSDVSVFFPSAFLSPQSLPPHPASDDDLYSYGIDDGLTDDYGTISPPAEYAEVDRSNEQNGANTRYGYQRSFSHSQTVVKDPAEYSPSYNINSHKSLPDLHSQISRHSPHSEVLSCCSRGNRSNKSGSSFNRDSGGSSGHYTHRSEPCCKQKETQLQQTQLQQGQSQQQQQPTPQMCNQDYRRDSGSSTQHSGNSYYNNYGIISNYRYDCAECRAKLQKDAECLLNFTTPEVPEAFQDDYDDKTKRYDDSPRKYYSKGTKSSPPPPPLLDPPITPPDPSELSPPLGTFKRQKCLRFKHRTRYSNSNQSHEQCIDDRRPILRSKSDISDRYWSRTMPIIDSNKIDKRVKSESMSQLEKFFDRLGLNDETYEKYIAPKSPSNYNSSDNDSDQSSPVFFSDVSTVDSNRLPDSTETQPQTTQQNPALYRPSEPPSIVERNARIIKWLCNCKKLQLA